MASSSSGRGARGGARAASFAQQEQQEHVTARPLSASESVSELAASAIAEARRRFMDNADVALLRATPESVHQARVALRKLRLYLRLFRSRIERARGEQLAGDLRWAFAAFGRLRDWQIFQRDVLPRASEAPAASSSLRAFSARVGRRLAAARAQLSAEGSSERYRQLCAELAQLEAELRARADSKRPRAWLAKRLRRMRRRALAEARAMQGKGAELHALRKRLKKLRYAAQLADALGARHPKRARKFQARLSTLQDVLGKLNDLRVARRLITAAHAAQGLRGQLRAQLSAAEHACSPDLERALAQFEQAPAPWK